MWSKTFFFVRIDLSFLLKYYTRDEISIKTVIEEGIHQWHGNMWLIISQFGCNNRVCPCAEWVARGRLCWAIHHELNTGKWIHNHESHRSDFVCFTDMCITCDQDMMFCILSDLVFFIHPSSPTALSSKNISWSRLHSFISHIIIVQTCSSLSCCQHYHTCWWLLAHRTWHHVFSTCVLLVIRTWCFVFF